MNKKSLISIIGIVLGLILQIMASTKSLSPAPVTLMQLIPSLILYLFISIVFSLVVGVILRIAKVDKAYLLALGIGFLAAGGLAMYGVLFP